MRNYIILNGNNSNEITGLLIQSLPPISKPLMRTAIEEIDGRDGDIVTTLGYSAYDKELSIGLYGSYDVDEVIKYFSDNSKGQVTFSNEPDKYYNYEIINQIDFERLIRFKTATVTLHCQPFKYPTEETPVEIAYQYVNNEAEEMDLDNTADAPMEIDLKGNTYQDSTSGYQLLDIGTSNGDYDRKGSSPSFLSINNNTISLVIQASGGTFCYRKQNLIGNKTFTISSNASEKYMRYFIRIRKTDDSGWMTDSDTTISGWTYNSYYEGWYITNSNTTTPSITFTIPQCLYWQIGFGWDTRSWTGETKTITNIILNEGQTAREYEPYTNGPSPNPDYPQDIHVVTGDNEVTICGKNMFDKDNANVLNAYISNDSNTVVSNNANRLLYISCQPNTTYTFRKITSATFAVAYTKELPQGGVAIYNFSNSTTNLPNNYKAITITTGESAKYLVCRFMQTAQDTMTQEQILATVQIEKGSTATDYEAYAGQSQLISLGSIELCKIGNYQDYIYKDSDKWYLHKEIEKVVLDGSESWSNYNSTNKSASYRNTDLWTSNDYYDAISDKFIYLKASQSSLTNGTFKIQNKQLYLCLANESSITDTTTLTAWLSTHNIELYYVLLTPTDTEITDTTLLEQLENIANARSYDTSTHITQNANDKPFILNATALQKGSDTGIVDNDGNIYSKPTLDIEGTGTVAIYLNGNQMFSVDLSNSDECVIDVTNLEAYDPETNELMNRQVTGDYSNFTLPVGENTVKVSGTVTKATITDYTRYL